MFLLFAAKRKLSSSSIPPIFAASHSLLPRCRGYASNKNLLTNPMLVDYLVATYGFSPAKAALVSKRSDHLKSPDKPEAVRSFLNKEGFSDAQVKIMVTLCPDLLRASPDNTLEPNLRVLRSTGLSSSDLKQLILSDPAALHLSSAASRIKFWKDFFGGDEAALLKAFKHGRGLSSHDISMNIAPKVSLFQSHGPSTGDVQSIMLKAPGLIKSKVSLLEEALHRAKELGFKPKSGIFVNGLYAMVKVSREALQMRMEIFKSFGWSEDEFRSAVRKAPTMVTLSGNSLQTKMDFLVREAKCDPSYIASSPVLLTYSLEKRLRPRLCVLHHLKSKGVSIERMGFRSALSLSDNDFVERFIVPHREGIAGLHETYLAACA